MKPASTLRAAYNEIANIHIELQELGEVLTMLESVSDPRHVKESSAAFGLCSKVADGLADRLEPFVDAARKAAGPEPDDDSDDC